MPKRIATPPLIGDTKYLTIVSPYPHPNWDLIADRVAFARWMACALGDYQQFFSFYYKPRGRGMVIVEIDRDYGNFKDFLGEHRWIEFLREPTEEEKERKSQVFYCLYQSDREAQKDGWLRIAVEEEWFSADKWSLKNKIIKYPYPSNTYWCAPPPDTTQNHRNLCRPLPVADHPPPPRKETAPVVGSSDWASGSRRGSAPTRAQKGKSRGRGSVNRTLPSGDPGSTPLLPRKKTPWANTNANDAHALPKMSQTLALEQGVAALSLSSYDDDDDDDEDDGLPRVKKSTTAVVELPESLQALLKPTIPKEPEALCPAHGLTCNKGICEEMSKLKRENALAEKKAKREKDRQIWEEKRNGKGKKGKEKADDESTEPGSSSVKSSDSDSSGRGTPTPSTQGQDETASSTKGSVKIDNPWDVAEDAEF